MRVLAAVPCLALIVTGCGKKSSDSASTTPLAAAAAPLTTSDLGPSNGFTLNTKKQSEMIDYLNGLSDLYDNQPDKTTPSACDDTLNAVKIQANKASVLVDTTLDLATCTNASFKAQSVDATATTVSMRFYLYVTCTSGDFSSLDGKTLKELTATSPDTFCTAGTSLSQVKTTMNGTYNSEGTAIPMVIASAVHIGSSTGGACGFSVANNVHTADDGCISVTKEDTTMTITGVQTKSENFTKLTQTGVTDDAGSKTAVWHSGGKMGITYDNWTGTVTYTASSTAPTYSMTPTGGAAVTGSLTATAGLALTEAARTFQVPATRW